LLGLKENVILGHLVPAGTGFHTHQEAEVRIRPEALMELQAEKERIRLARLDLLSDPSGAAGNGETETQSGNGSDVATAEGSPDTGDGEKSQEQAESM
jgi:DNA-directed RNA polymerase subunit beta'